MPKRELSKCREWERERRDRLKTCFTALGRLLPCYDPSVVLSKLEILQRAAAYIEELQRKNKDLVLGDENVSSVQNDEIKHLHERVRKLVVRNEQLANLLHDAGIKVPSECGGVRTFREPLLWSNRITAERAEVLRTRHMANKQPTTINNTSSNQANSKRKRKLPPSSTSSGSTVSPQIGPANKRRKIRRRKQAGGGGGGVVTVNSSSIVTVAAVRRKKERQTTASGTRISTSGISAAAAAVLGPGTLILANGSVVPVLPPPVHLVVASTAATTTPPIIVMRQPRVGNLPLLKPKVPGGCTRTTTVNKLPIPALSSRHALTNFVHNNRAAAVGRTATTKKRTRKATTPATTATGPADKGSSDCVSVQSADGVVGAPAVTDPADGVASTGADVPSSVVTAAEPNVVSSTAAVSVSYSIDSVLCSVRESPAHTAATTTPTEAVAGVAVTTAAAVAVVTATPAMTASDGNIVTSSSVTCMTDTPTTTSSSPSQPVMTTAATVATTTTTTTTTVAAAHPEDALSSDLFATLHVSAGTSGAAAVSGHAECMSPTAAFLLAFPLVSTLGSGGRVTEVLVDSTEDTPDSRQGTPTTLLQIGGTMMLDNKPQHQPPTVPLATTASSTSTAAGGLVDTFGPFGFATASDKDLHYDLRPAPAISTYEHSSQVKVVGSKSCVYEQQQQHGKSTGRTEPAASVTGSNSTAYNPFADLYVPPVQSSLYSAGCTPYQTQYEPPVPAPVPVTPASTTGNKHTADKHRLKERPPVNWMTSPDVRQHQQQQQQQQFRQPTYMQQHHTSNNAGGGGTGTDFYFQPFSSKELDMYSSTGGESGNRTRTEYVGYTDTAEHHQHQQQQQQQQQQYAWSPSKLAPLHHPLPTLVGDLALGNNTGTEGSKRSSKEPADTASNFLSVSQLVEPGLGKGHSSEQLVPGRINKKHTAQAGSSSSRTNSGGGVQRRAHREKSAARHTGYSAEALLATTNHNQQQYMYEQYLPGESATQYTQQQQQQQQQQSHHQQQQQQHYQQQQYTSSNHHQQQQRQQLTMFSSAGGSSTAGPGYVPAPPPLLPPAPAELAGDYTALLADTFATFTSKPPASVPAFDSFSTPSIISSRGTSRPRSSMVEGSEDRRRTTASKRNTSGRHQPTSRTTEPPPVTTGAAGFAELGFLSMPAAATTIGSSPLLPDEFHAHTFPPHAAAPQLYQQNPLYPRRTFVPQPEVRNSSSSGPAATTGANTLTNFNLTTIFPEMNKNVAVSSSSSSSRPSRTSLHHQQQNQQAHQSRHHNQHTGYIGRHHQQQQQQHSHNTAMYQYPGAT